MRYIIAVCASVLGTPAIAQCPATPIGVTITAEAHDRVFFATAKAEPLADTDGSQQLARAEARLVARASLLADKEVPKVNGRLRGIREYAACKDGDAVYVTLRLSESDMRRAAMLGDAMSRSLQQSPTPR